MMDEIFFRSSQLPVKMVDKLKVWYSCLLWLIFIYLSSAVQICEIVLYYFITGFVTRLTRRVPLVEQELLTLPEHMSSPLVFSGVRVTRSSDICVCFVDRCLSFCPFSFGHCVVYSTSIYGFWFPLWYLQTLLRSVLKI